MSTTDLSNLFEAVVRNTGTPSARPEFVDAADAESKATTVRDGHGIVVVHSARAHIRRHVFHDLEGFARFVQREYSENAGKVDVLVDGAEVVVDPAPGNADADVVRCVLSDHPRWQRWQRLLGRPLSQRDLVRLVATSLDDFPQAETASGVPAGSFGQELLQQVSKFHVIGKNEVETRYDASGALIFAAGKGGDQVQGKLAPSFPLRLPIMRGARDETGEYLEYDVEVFIALEINENKQPEFTLEAPGFPVVKDRALDDSAVYLGDKLGEAFLVVRGKHGVSLTRGKAAFERVS